MSSTSSILAGYDNNNGKKRVAVVATGKDIPKKKYNKGAEAAVDAASTAGRRRKCGVHLNNLWSFWYGILATGLQGYAAVKCLKRILGYSFLTWPENLPIPFLELNVSLGLTGAAVLLVPLFFVAAIFKIGNLANDGHKLGRDMSVCSRDTPYVLREDGGGVVGSCHLFRHGGPTAPFVHLVIAFCLLVPKLLMEARLIEGGFLSEESIWRTDLDFMVVHKDRLVVLSFMTSNTSVGGNASVEGVPTPLPFKANNPVTHTVIKTLKELIGHDNNTHPQHDSLWGSSVSVEYLNLALALLVYSVRYPALFWSTNKCIGVLFSFQLLINGLHTLLSYAGMSILYKVQIVGVVKSLPLLRHQASLTAGPTPFLLNPQVSLALYLLSTILVLASSLVLYLYGHTRLIAFLNQERERKVITLKDSGSNKWAVFTHCAALCVLVAVGVCYAPLLHDYTVVYRGSLDDTVLACIIGGILHLFLWVVVWLFLTIKQNWVFKLRVTIGRATVRSTRSIKLVTDVDYKYHHSEDPATQPLLVVGNGRTYTISDNNAKKSIMGAIQKASTSQRKTENGFVSSNDGEEQIYWLRPALVTPQSSPDGSKGLCWFNKKPKHKVTFNEASSTSVNRRNNSGNRGGRSNDEDDGDYATLRQLPLPPSSSTNTDTGDDTASEEGKLLACVHDEEVTYVATTNVRDLVPPNDIIDDPSPLLTPEPLFDHEDDHRPTNHHTNPISVVVHNTQQQLQLQQQQQQQQLPSGLTPRCLRRADSGMPHEELTPRSDSASTECSTSPPEAPGSNHSETSSGVHSNDSSEPHHHQQQQVGSTRRATSVADLVQPILKEEVQWKSCSLQRNMAPPTSSPPHYVGSSSVASVFRYSGSPTYIPGSSKPIDQIDHAIPAVILENPSESTVVIRRKAPRPKTNDIIGPGGPPIKEEPFGRATNMRMTSFMENSDLKNIQASSATLPLYPTQPVSNVYPHCSTMPLPQPHVNNTPPVVQNLGCGNSCNVYPRQHTTIPIHHNGVKLFNTTQNPYIKRLQEGPPKMNGLEPIYTGINRASGESYHYST